MNLRSNLREEEYATKTHHGDHDRDIKHAILIEKHTKFTVAPVKGTYHGHKVHFSDVSYMQAIQDTIMAEDIEV